MHENDKAILMIRDGWVMWGHLYCGLLAAMSALTFTWPSLAIVRCLYSGSWHHHLLCPFVPPLRSRPISNTTITSSPPPARNWGGHCQDIKVQDMNFRLSLTGYPGIVRAHPVVGVSGVAIVANARARPALVSALQLCPTNTISPSLCRT